MSKWKKGNSARQFAEQAVDRIIDQLNQGVAPWQKGWDRPTGLDLPPYNPVTGTRYRGLNSFILQSEGEGRGYADPRWTTYRGALKIGAQVRRGEKGVAVEYWKFPSEEDKDQFRAAFAAGEEPERLRVIHRTYTVFNAEQIESMPARENDPTEVNRWESCERAEALLKASGARIEHRRGNDAFYLPSEDLIVLPKQQQFHSPESYYSTALHELGHWTGHKSRLDRGELLESSFGSPDYAKEELRAEMTSATVNGMLQLPHDPERQASYVWSWIKTLRDNPNELRYAARDAGRMADYILQFDRRPERQPAETSREAGDTASIPERSMEVIKQPEQQLEKEPVVAMRR